MNMKIIEEIKKYRPCNAQEQRDQALILDFLEKNGDAFLRSNLLAHMTASSWIVNPERTKTLMVYHNLYDSWSWTGGHADGETDLLSVALREAREETGIAHVRPLSPEIFSLEVLTVDGHEKRGEYNGVSGAICPFSREDIAVKYGDSEHTFDSVDAFMNEPFIEGKPLKDIIENFTI